MATDHFSILDYQFTAKEKAGIRHRSGHGLINKHGPG